VSLHTNGRTRSESFAALWLPSLHDGTAKIDGLLLPLTVAFLLSAHLPFRCPVKEEMLPVVDRAFDEILRGLSLDSKGIQYVTDEASVAEALGGACFVITDETGEPHSALQRDVPMAVLVSVNGHGYALRPLRITSIRDAEMRSKLASCAQLLNIQAGGLISQGAFTWSW
jgi:hypothetical protein